MIFVMLYYLYHVIATVVDESTLGINFEMGFFIFRSNAGYLSQMVFRWTSAYLAIDHQLSCRAI